MIYFVNKMQKKQFLGNFKLSSNNYLVKKTCCTSLKAI